MVPGRRRTPARADLLDERPSRATQAELQNFFAQLEAELDDCGFLRNLEMRPTMVRNIRAIWQRAELTSRRCAPCTASSPG